MLHCVDYSHPALQAKQGAAEGEEAVFIALYKPWAAGKDKLLGLLDKVIVAASGSARADSGRS